LPEVASKTTQELNALKEEVRFWDDMEGRLSGLQKELNELIHIEKEEERVPFEQDIIKRFQEIRREFKKAEIVSFFSGPYDKNNVFLTILSGAGGRDAEDWAEMLLRMFQRYAERKKFTVSLIHTHEGQEGGIKNATIEIKGAYAYGSLKGERGVHRLVRISPFSSQQLRHTSFAMVEVLPDISSDKEDALRINPEDIRVDTFRSSGPGGQNVNKRETAVRITHIPTGVVVDCQSERFQQSNKEKAMQLLKAKLHHLLEQEKKKELSDLKGGKIIKAEWGSQIRSYVIHPYKMVKDHRTDVETSNVEEVLDGDLDAFIEAEVRTLKM
jgi:peptide chain release factor 2